MSRGMNHSRVSMQKRIARETYQYDYGQQGWSENNWKRRKKKKQIYLWKLIYLPTHFKETLPMTTIYDPEFVIRTYVDDILFRVLGKEEATRYQIAVANQLEAIANRAQHILPPKPFDEFVVIVDVNGVFERVEPVKRGRFPKKPLKKGSRIVKRITELDIALPCFYANLELGLERIGHGLRMMFFGTDTPTTQECEKWYADDTNFNLKGLRSHVSVKSSEEDEMALARKYFKSLRR
jgi:hypothetical protein